LENLQNLLLLDYCGYNAIADQSFDLLKAQLVNYVAAKGETSQSDLTKLEDYFKTGLGKKNLDNAVTWIYRNNFSYKELEQLVKFYKSPAGQKMADRFPIIMLQSLTAAQILQENFMTHQER